jgi:O-antigen/teichoic acid export membrane protein
MQMPDANTGSSAAGDKGVSVAPAVHTLPGVAVAPSEPALRNLSTLWDIPIDRMRAWGLRGASSILQQGFFAGAHFATNVLLARWLSPVSYGAFALAYSIFLLPLTLHGALFSEPMLVYGPGRHAGEFPSYVRVLVRAHFFILVPASLLIAPLGLLFARLYTREFKLALLSLIVMLPLLLLIWFSRGVLYAQLNPHAGTVAGSVYFSLLLFSMWLLRSTGNLSPASALVGMGIGSLLVSVGCLYQFRRTKKDQLKPELKTARVLSEHWKYGRWAALTAIAVWIPANIFYALLPRRFGLESAALLRALMNLMLPLGHTVTALVLLLIPILVRQRERLGLQSMKRTVFQLVALLVPVGILYLCFLIAFHAPILHLLYAGRYSDVSAWTIALIGLLPITSGVAGILGAALRAIERPHLIFWGYLASTVMALAAGVPITLHYGVTGAAFALVLDDLPAIAVIALCLSRCGETRAVPARPD